MRQHRSAHRSMHDHQYAPEQECGPAPQHKQLAMAA